MESSILPVIDLASVSTFSVIIVALITIFQKLKFRWPVKVNCWFCNCNTRIWKKQLNWWLCPSCEQYNGFNKDGDYKYSIPEQSFMRKPNVYTVSDRTKLSNQKNGLCDTCNDNEEFKLMKLRRFESSKQRYSDNNLRKFKQECEEKYPLCANCSNVVKSSLYKQSLWLAEYKMLFFRQKPIQDIINNKQAMDKLYRFILIVVNVAINCRSLLWPMLISGTFCQLMLCFVNTARKKLISNILLVILWINIGILSVLPELFLLWINVHNSWFSLNSVTTYHVIVLFRMIIAFENIKPNLKRANHDVSFKKIASCKKNFTSIRSKINTNASIDNNNGAQFQKLTHCQSPVNISNILSTSVALETPVPIKAGHFQKWISPDKIYICNQSETSVNTLNDSMKSLSSLSLTDITDCSSSKSSSVFSTKIYNTTSPDLFQKQSGLTRKLILAPAKLKTATQMPWPANNFWHEDLEPPSMSRSSSQSSGFGSTGLTRENSVFDLDQCSVMSDVTLCCHQRHNSESPVYRTKSKKECTSRESTPRCSYHSTKYEHSIENSLPEEKVLTTTIVTSPPWLPALVCGSLIFNVAILCAVLSR